MVLEYNSKFIPIIIENITNTSILKIKNILLPTTHGIEDSSIIKELLSLNPTRLFGLQCKLMEKLISGYGTRDLIRYKEIKNKKVSNRSNKENLIFRKYDEILKELGKIFDYNKLISKNKSNSYTITTNKGRNSCTYCNRQYTQTIIVDNGINDIKRIARPQLDHWFSKELYPLMGMSYYNLIPSCSICNSSLKGTVVFNLSTHIHPYDCPEIHFKFISKLSPDGYTYEIGIDDSACSKKERHMLEIFKIEDIYKFHSKLELKDIIDFDISVTETYLSTLYNQTLLRFSHKTKEEVYRMLFGAEHNDKDYLDRPLSKLKNDILREKGIIK